MNNMKKIILRYLHDCKNSYEIAQSEAKLEKYVISKFSPPYLQKFKITTF